MTGGIVLEVFGGPGGLAEGARMVGVRNMVGLELDKWACATRAAAGHRTIRCDVAQFDVSRLAGRVRATCGSPPCSVFSAAGTQAGNALTDQLAALIRDLFAGSDTRAARRREMGRLRHAAVPVTPTVPRRAHKIAAGVRSAALVAEPARFIAACDPEWVALEQVPAVLPLWQVYADELRKRGYSAWAGLLNSANYGVPQTRIRAILVASRVRQVYCPPPTHYDQRKGMQLFGLPWVSMAEALGWGATGRPAPTTTAGGTATGGAEPFGRGGRVALEAERDAGRWVLVAGNQKNAAVRPAPAPAPAPAIAFGHAGADVKWVLCTNRDQREDGSRQTADPSAGPAPSVTGKSGGQWVLRRDRGAGLSERHGERDDYDLAEPAPTISAGTHGSGPRMTWRLGGNGNACEGPNGEHHFTVDSVRITPEEAAALQSFPPGYPFKGTKTAVFGQIGNAVPPLLAAHVLSMATGLPLPAEIEGAA